MRPVVMRDWTWRDWITATFYAAPLHLAMLLMEDVTRYTGLARPLTARLQAANDRIVATFAPGGKRRLL